MYLKKKKNTESKFLKKEIKTVKLYRPQIPLRCFKLQTICLQRHSKINVRNVEKK